MKKMQDKSKGKPTSMRASVITGLTDRVKRESIKRASGAGARP